MTVLSVVQDAAVRIGVARPDVLFSGTDRTAISLQEMVNEAAAGCVDDYDWQRFKKVATITGDGTTTEWDLPSDYRRMLKKARFWPSAMPSGPLVFVTDADKWLELETQNVSTVQNRVTLFGNQLVVKPAIASGATVKYFYVSNLIVITSGDSTPTKTAFTADTDTFALDPRLLKLGLVWRWKAAHGRPYAQDQDSYNELLDALAGPDRGARMLHVGKLRIPDDVTLAYPWSITP